MVIRRYARAVLITEVPQEFESINEAALEWCRNRIVVFACLLIGITLLSIIATAEGGLQSSNLTVNAG
jgi:hypothetical protein